VLAASLGGPAAGWPHPSGGPPADHPDAGQAVAPPAVARRPDARRATRHGAAPVNAGTLTLVTEPDDGIGAIYALLSSPRHTLDLELYELRDPLAEQLLAADARRGVRVRVLLDRHYREASNLPAYRYLSAHGVAVRWAPAAFDLTHEKAFVVDGRVATIMTLNLESEYYTSTRDFAVVVRDPLDAAAVETVFDADWAGGAGAAPTGTALVWSPEGSQAALLALIGGARRSLLVENEEMDDPDIVAALVAAARRGVDVEVCMTDDAEWHGAFGRLAAGGVHVRTYPADAPLYIHAKALVADGGLGDERGFVGSENFSVASLRYNRELGIELSAPTLLRRLATTLASDFAGARPWV